MAGNSTPEGAAHALAVRWQRYYAEEHPRRFWSRVDMSAGPEDCWPWLGKVMPSRGGYGRHYFRGRLIGAHRMALTLTDSPPPDDRPIACHDCDNPICCNPRHLWWGTTADNDADARAKGRKRGAVPKIDLQRLTELRRTGRSYSELADELGVNQASIGKALKRLGMAGAIRPNQACLRALASRLESLLAEQGEG